MGCPRLVRGSCTFVATLANRRKIESNYPSTDITLAAIRTVLGWPDNRGEVTAILDGIIQRATAVDGVSGEKGTAGYATIAPRTIADRASATRARLPRKSRNIRP